MILAVFPVLYLRFLPSHDRILRDRISLRPMQMLGQGIVVLLVLHMDVIGDPVLLARPSTVTRPLSLSGVGRAIGQHPQPLVTLSQCRRTIGGLAFIELQALLLQRLLLPPCSIVILPTLTET
jgi:hypothetical protein